MRKQYAPVLLMLSKVPPRQTTKCPQHRPIIVHLQSYIISYLGVWFRHDNHLNSSITLVPARPFRPQTFTQLPRTRNISRWLTPLPLIPISWHPFQRPIKTPFPPNPSFHPHTYLALDLTLMKVGSQEQLLTLHSVGWLPCEWSSGQLECLLFDFDWGLFWGSEGLGFFSLGTGCWTGCRRRD